MVSLNDIQIFLFAYIYKVIFSFIIFSPFAFSNKSNMCYPQIKMKREYKLTVPGKYI